MKKPPRKEVMDAQIVIRATKKNKQGLADQARRSKMVLSDFIRWKLWGK